MFIKSSFDIIYASTKFPTFGLIPTFELKHFIKDNKMIGTALDLGCGDGRDTLFLAEIGWDMTAIDISIEAIRKLRIFAKKQGLTKKIKAIHSDIRMWSYPKNYYDLIIAITCLDHINKKDCVDVLKRIRYSLKNNGITFIQVHTIDDPGYFKKSSDYSELSYMIKHYFKRNELLYLVQPSFYIIKYEEKKEKDLDHGKPHYHGFAYVIAKKYL